MSRLALVLLAASALVQDAAPPATGWVLERKVHVRTWDLVRRTSECRRVERIRISGGDVAVEDLTFGTTLVIRPGAKKILRVDHVGRTWSETGFEALAARKAAVLAELAAARDRVPGTRDAEDISTTLFQLGVLPEGEEIAVVDTGKSENVLGRDCPGREIRIGKDVHYIAVQVDPSLAGALAYYDALAAAGAFHPKVAAKLRELGGFPVKGEVRYALFLEPVASTEEVVGAQAAAVPASAFEVPAGYAKTPFEGVDVVSGAKPEKPKQFEKSFREDDLDRPKNEEKK